MRKVIIYRDSAYCTEQLHAAFHTTKIRQRLTSIRSTHPDMCRRRNRRQTIRHAMPTGHRPRHLADRLTVFFYLKYTAIRL